MRSRKVAGVIPVLHVLTVGLGVLRRDLGRVPFKMAYKAALLERCERLRADGRAVVFCGDINTAHREIDLARPKQNRQSSGFRPEERQALDLWLRRGWTDTLRQRATSGNPSCR